MRRQLMSLEESAVEALMQVDEANKQQAQDAAALESMERQWAAKVQELLAEENKTKRIALQLRTNRSKLVEGIPARDVQLYEDLRKRRAGIAVAPIVNGQCSACNVKVPTGVASAAHSATAPAYCTSCGRILVLPAS
jgi:predicted  nucleic acid-binding Zn-ribbon protein